MVALIAAAVTTADASLAQGLAPNLTRASDRLFISPMGEPFSPTATASAQETWFRQTDGNGDGSITLLEMQTDAVRYFKSLDVRHDGEIDPGDIELYEAEVGPDAQIDKSDFVIMMRQPIMSADLNFDRGVSVAEFTRAAGARFRLVDTNHDGKIALPELQAIVGANAQTRRKYLNGPQKRNSDGEPVYNAEMAGPGR